MTQNGSNLGSVRYLLCDRWDRSTPFRSKMHCADLKTTVGRSRDLSKTFGTADIQDSVTSTTILWNSKENALKFIQSYLYKKAKKFKSKTDPR